MLGELGLEHLGDGGILIAVLIALIILGERVLRPIVEAWLKNINAQNEREHEKEKLRIANDKEQTSVLHSIDQRLIDDQHSRAANTEVLTGLTTVVSQMNKNLMTQSTMITDAIAVMSEVTEKRVQKLDAMHSDIQNVPAAVWEQGDPKLTAIETLLKQYLEGLEERITSRIGADETHRSAVMKAVQTLHENTVEQFGQITTHLQELDNLLNQFSPQEGSHDSEH